jgi:hypothetical protein
VLGAGALFATFHGSYPLVGATCGLIYALGMVVIWWVPNTTGRQLDDGLETGTWRRRPAAELRQDAAATADY